MGCWRKQEENLKALLATSWPMSKLSRKACRNCWLRKAASLAERQPPWCQGKSRQEPRVERNTGQTRDSVEGGAPAWLELLAVCREVARDTNWSVLRWDSLQDRVEGQGIMWLCFCFIDSNKSRIQETLNLSMCADSSNATKEERKEKEEKNPPVMCHLSPVMCHVSPVTEI